MGIEKTPALAGAAGQAESELSALGRAQKPVLAAAELFLRHGIEPVKMTDIAKAGGVGVASLYRYFKTKANLAAAAGALLWQDAETLFDETLRSAEYRKKNGAEQVKTLLSFFTELYQYHAPFLRFLEEFDRMMLQEKADEAYLARYEASMFDFYELFCAALQKGEADGSVRKGLDHRQLYRTYTHAMTALAQKFIRGPILPSDDYTGAVQELSLLAETTVYFIGRNKP